MATFRNIGVEESATVTQRVATVQIARGSTNEQQEIMVLGDAESSLGLARILNSTPASTEYGLAVRVVEQPSTVVSVSTGSVRVHQSSAADLNVTVAGYSTVVSVSTGSVRVHQSSAADLNVTVAGYSTTAQVSSVGGIVTVRPSDTNWASSAGFHFDSSGALQITGTFSASTTVNVSSVSGVVTVNPQATSNSSVYMPVRLTDGTAFLTIGSDYTDGSTYSSLTGGGLAFNNSSANTFRIAGTAQPFPVHLRTSSGADVSDSTNGAIKVNVVAGSAAGSTIVTVSTGSVRVHQSSAADLNVTVSGYSTTAQVSSVGGIVAVRPSDTNWASSAGFHFDSSGALQITGTFSASTVVTVSTGSVRVHQSSAADLNVTVAGYSTIVSVSTGSVRVHQSSAADLNVTVAGYSTVVSVSTGSVRVHQSSAADLNVTVSGYSTTVNVSSLGGAVIVRSSAADALVTVYQSTASALQVTATIGTNLQSTAAPSSNSSGLVVRQVVDVLLTTASTNAMSGSTSFSIQSSGANLRSYVTAYSILTTNAGPTQVAFYSSGTMTWPMVLAAVSSAVTGVNLAVAPPGYLFRTNASEDLTLRTNGSTVVGWVVAVSYFRAP